MPKHKFQMDLILRGAVEQYVSSYCLLQTRKKFPQILGGHVEQQEYHEKCDAYFQTMFERIMDDLKVSLRSPGWLTTMFIPLEEQTILKMESNYEAPQ